MVPIVPAELPSRSEPPDWAHAQESAPNCTLVDGEGQRSRGCASRVESGRRSGGPLDRRGQRRVKEPAGPLRGVRVLDLSWGVAGPVGVLLLAELGADVVKVEPPGGDPFRAQPAYHVWNRSRRSVVIDLKSALGREAFLRLCDGADVVVETFSPGTMDRLGLSYAELSERFPRLVYCSVPAYPPGHRFADRPGWEGAVQARSGMQNEQPGWRPGPVFLHFPAPSMAACFLLATGVLSALVHREESGRGQHVQTSLYQGVLAYTTQIWQEHERSPAGYRSVMAKTYPPGVHQTSLFECADGEWIHAATMNGMTPTRTPEEILGLDPVDQRGIYADPEQRARHDARLREAYRARSREELIEAFHEAGLGAEAVTPMAEVFSHAQFVANGHGGDRRGPRARFDHTGRRAGRARRHPRRHSGRPAPSGRAQPGGPARSRVLRRRGRRAWSKPGSSRRTRRGPTERCRGARSGPVPGRAVRHHAARRPRCRSHQGGAGTRRRHAHGRHAVPRVPAGQARHRRRRQGSRGPGGRDAAGRAGGRGPPQHDEGDGGPAGGRLRGTAGPQSRARALQHVRLRRRGTALAVRRARSALPGCLRARVRVRSRGRGQPTPVSPLRHDRHGQCHGLGRRGARRPVPPASHRRGSGPLDIPAQRRGGVQLRRLPGRWGARTRPSRPRPEPDRRLPVLPVVRDPAGLDPGGGLRSRAVVPDCAGSSAGRTSSATTRWRRGSPPAPRSSPPSSSPSARAPPRPGRTTWPRPGWRPKCRSTPTTGRSRCTTPTTSGWAWSSNTRIRRWATCANSAPWSTSRRPPPGRTGRRPWWGSTPGQLMERVGYSPEEIDDLLARGIVYEPTEDYRWAQ